MKRIIAHWSEGRHKANDTDREHYHVLVEGGKTPRLVRGEHSIADNASTGDGVYAAHTRGCNTGSIGIALCGMMGCEEFPFEAGPEPITEAQWHLMVDAIAVLCQRYGIPVTPQTVLCHGEVQANLGIKQRGKWDPMRWPWASEVPGHRIGDLLRAAVRDALMGGGVPDTKVHSAPVSRTVHLPGGKSLATGQVHVEDGETFVALRPLCELLGWTISGVRKSRADLVLPLQDGLTAMPLLVEGGTGFVSVRDVAKVLGASVAWDSKTKSVTISLPATTKTEN
jgi:hypothetical protein